MGETQCPHCGKNIKKSDYFCPRCGEIVAGGLEIAEEALSDDLMEKIDLSDYSDYIRILFNSRMDKWELNLLESGRHVLRKHFFERSEAEREAVHYLKVMGILNQGPSSASSGKRGRANYGGVFYSDTRSMWGVRVSGYRGSRILGYYASEKEAVEARENYVGEKSAKQTAMRKEKNIKTKALISFSERAGLWVVRMPKKRGGYELLGYYDSEDEAVEAKDAYLKEKEEQNQDDLVQ